MILLCLVLCLPVFAAETMKSVIGTEYGAWSEWSETPVEKTENLEVERAMRAISQSLITWRYSRYVYYNEQIEGWFAAATEQTGDHSRAGSGRWERHESSEALAVIGQDGDHLMYAGNWYNEEVTNAPSMREMVMYRSRRVKRFTCEINTSELLVFPEEKRQLTVNMFDDNVVYNWLSIDSEIAVVDGNGMVTGVKPGITTIIIRSGTGREVRCRVLVCEKSVKVPEGLYTFRLGKTNRTLMEGSTTSQSTRNLYAIEFTGERKQRFIVKNVSGNTFKIQPLNHKKWAVDISYGKKGMRPNNVVRVSSRKSTRAQQFRAIYVPDGSYIIYPKEEPRLVLGVEPFGKGANARLELAGNLEEADRWVLVKADESISPETPFARPVIRDGRSYVAVEYDDKVDPPIIGTTIGSNDRSEYVLSSARGKVVTIFDKCVHDYAKSFTAAGTLVDPCEIDNPEGKLGNHIVIDHGGGVLMTYSHLSEIYVKQGQTVRQGTMVGRSGATGATEEINLYVTMTYNEKPVNMRDYIDMPGIGKPIE